MENARVVTIVGVVMVLAAVLVGCGPSKTDLEKANGRFTALKNASAFYQEFLNAQTGGGAVGMRDKMRESLHAQSLSYHDLSVSEVSLQNRIRELYISDATAVYKRLQGTRGNIKLAQDLAAQYGELVGEAGQTVSPRMERSLALQVARNKKEEGVAMERAHGVYPAVKKAPAAKRLVAKKATKKRPARKR